MIVRNFGGTADSLLTVRTNALASPLDACSTREHLTFHLRYISRESKKRLTLSHFNLSLDSND